MAPDVKSEHWNRFWKAKMSSRFTRASWSKRRMMALLDGVVRPAMSVLDAGCGSGFFSRYFLDRGADVFSLDYSREALEIARRSTENRCSAYLEEDLLAPAFGDRYSGRFDLIFTDGLFEHFSAQDQARILDNFKRAKKPGGLIATFVPNRYSWWEVIRPLVMPGIQEEPFSLGGLLRLHAGLEIVESGGLNVLPLALSPEALGPRLGMLLYCFAR